MSDTYGAAEYGGMYGGTTKKPTANPWGMFDNIGPLSTGRGGLAQTANSTFQTRANDMEARGYDTTSRANDYYGPNAVWHMEGGLGTRSAVVKFQLRPNPLAK